MKRVMNDMCFQTLGYLIGGDQIVVIKDYKEPSDITWEHEGEDKSIKTIEVDHRELSGYKMDKYIRAKMHSFEVKDNKIIIKVCTAWEEY